MHPVLDQKQKAKQTQHLMMSPEMQQSIQLLQLPVMELSQVIEQEIEQNPVLEYEQEEAQGSQEEKETPEKEVTFDEHQFEMLKKLDEEFKNHLEESGPYIPPRCRSSDDAKMQTYLENNLMAEPSLYDYLMAEAREVLSDEEDLKIAEILIGYLDEKGFINTPTAEIAASFAKQQKDIERVLKIMQEFDPVGIGSKNIQEALLIQLKNKGQENSILYRLIALHYNDLLHNRLPLIQKNLKISVEELNRHIEAIGQLEFHPLSSFSKEEAPTLIPDIILKADGDLFTVQINEAPLRPLRMNHKYLKLLDDESVSQETKTFIKGKLLSAKWLMKNISQRGTTLNKIGDFIGSYQKEFFASPEGQLTPLIMKTVADDLGLHESTIARAISGKYIDTPRGIFPLRHFFSKAYIDQLGKNVSSKTVQQHILSCIEQEDKNRPLSDEAISALIQKMGISCARRTVAKYRTLMKIGNAKQRRRYLDK